MDWNSYIKNKIKKATLKKISYQKNKKGDEQK